MKYRHLSIIFCISIPFAFLYSQMAPTFECDATTAIGYARSLSLLLVNIFSNISYVILNPDLMSQFFELPSLNMGHYFYRPPGFPIFIILSGFFIIENLWSVFFLHLLISMCIPLISYLILKKIIKTKYAFYLTIILIISTLPFGFITYFLADNLLIFCVFMSTYYFVTFCKNNKIHYVYLSSFFATLALMTRTEGLISLICLIIFSLLIFLIKRKKLIEYTQLLAGIFLIPLIYILVWTGLVSYSIKDYKAFGNLTFGSGYFSMYSAYLGQNAGKIDSFLSSGLFNNQDYKYEIDDLYSNEINEVYKLVDPKNGQATKELFEKIENFLIENPESVNWMLKSLEESMSLSDDYPPEKAFYKLFGKYKNNPKGLAENFFNSPDNYYLDFFSAELIGVYGTVEIYSLYQKIFLETLISKPVILLVYLQNYFKTFSLDFNCILHYFYSNKFSCSKNNSFIFSLSLDTTHYIDWWFDAGKCPSSVLTKKAFDKYQDHFYSKVDNLNYFLTLDIIKKFYRVFFGFLYLFSIILIFFTKEKIINFYFLFLSQGNLVATVLGAGGSIATRNEHLNLMLMMFFCFIVLSTLKIKKRSIDN